MYGFFKKTYHTMIIEKPTHELLSILLGHYENIFLISSKDP